MSSENHTVNTQEGDSDIHPLSRKFLWLSNPKVKKNFIWVSVLGLIITALLLVIYPGYHPAPWEKGFAELISYGAIGLFAYTFVVLAAWPLFKALSRPEAFYGEGDDHDV